MSDDAKDRIEGLEAKELFRRALGDASGDPDAAERAAEEERRVRAEIEDRLPDLELLELLGRGGMGYVYRARQKKLDREVALKVIAPQAEQQADFAERFAREARALARLNHPNLVAVYDYGQDGPFSWLLMEFVDGSNLR
ncbi:MAG: protein kinase, partial [Gemmatimonadetes bacterium]|nr:protein kinase [Gemmatimonadota bacterium]